MVDKAKKPQAENLFDLLKSLDLPEDPGLFAKTVDELIHVVRKKERFENKLNRQMKNELDVSFYSLDKVPYFITLTFLCQVLRFSSSTVRTSIKRTGYLNKSFEGMLSMFTEIPELLFINAPKGRYGFDASKFSPRFLRYLRFKIKDHKRRDEMLKFIAECVSKVRRQFYRRFNVSLDLFVDAVLGTGVYDGADGEAAKEGGDTRTRNGSDSCSVLKKMIRVCESGTECEH